MATFCVNFHWLLRLRWIIVIRFQMYYLRELKQFLKIISMTFLFRQHLMMYFEQLFRVTFKKHQRTFRRASFFQYEIQELPGTSGLRSRLHNCEKMNLYLRRFSPFQRLCDEAISTIKILNEHTITPKDLSRINLIHALKSAVKKKN